MQFEMNKFNFFNKKNLKMYPMLYVLKFKNNVILFILLDTGKKIIILKWIFYFTWKGVDDNSLDIYVYVLNWIFNF